MDTKSGLLCTRRERRGRRPWCGPTAVRIVMMMATIGGVASACSQSPSAHGVTRATSAGGGSSLGSSASAGPLALARCMRAHGVHDFPDPDSDGNYDLSGEGDLTPNNPTFQAAALACRSLGSATKGSAHSLTPQQIGATVEFAQCMRNRGIRNYPDPNSSGQIPGIRHFGIDPNSPQFHSATDACEHYMRGIPGWP